MLREGSEAVKVSLKYALAQFYSVAATTGSRFCNKRFLGNEWLSSGLIANSPVPLNGRWFLQSRVFPVIVSSKVC